MKLGRSAATAALASMLALSSAANAADPPSADVPTSERDATAHYDAARRLYERGEREQALDEIERSLQLMPSPNSELLRAHLLRELGRNAEAMLAYERAENASIARLRGGEQRFEATVAEAGRWIALLRASLAELTVVVPAASTGTTVTIDGAAAESASRGPDGGLDVRVWHDPGTAVVAVRAPSGPPRTRSIALAAGASVRLVVDTPERPRPPPDTTGVAVAPAPPQRSNGIPPPPPASWVTGGIGVLGLGTFALFGALATSIESDLQQCAPNCPDARRADAEAGKRDQVIANVGLTIGIVGVATAALLWAVAPASKRGAHRAAAQQMRRAGGAPW